MKIHTPSKCCPTCGKTISLNKSACAACLAAPQPPRWDAEFSPLCLYFHYADPARASRVLVIGPAGREIVAETPESIAACKEFMGIDPRTRNACEAGGVLGSSASIRLRWADALAFLYRAEGTIVPIENRIPIHFEGEKWVLPGWAALDAGLVRTDLTWEPLSEQELTAFASKVGFASWSIRNIGQIAGIVMGQYQNDIQCLASGCSSNTGQLQRDLYDWVESALVSLSCVKEEYVMTKINGVKLFQRAYEMMAYDYSSVDPTEPMQPQYIEVGGIQIPVEGHIGDPPDEPANGA